LLRLGLEQERQAPTLALHPACASCLTVKPSPLVSHPHPTPRAEERIYRHRCVEAWAIVVPWVGFPLRKLLALVQPLPGAKFIKFETDKGSYMRNIGELMMGTGPPWPYVEGLAIRVGPWGEGVWGGLAGMDARGRWRWAWRAGPMLGACPDALPRPQTWRPSPTPNPDPRRRRGTTSPLCPSGSSTRRSRSSPARRSAST
jgi:hypothetical protein